MTFNALQPRKFGVEIEVSRRLVCVNNADRNYGQAWVEIENGLISLNSAGSIGSKWRLKVDTSCGGEAVSPPLIGPDGIRQVAYVCNLIRRVSKKYEKPAVDGECGLHIHLDAGGMLPKHLSRLFMLIHMAEPIIYAMYPYRNSNYCSPLEVNMRQASRLRDWVDVRDVWYRGSNNVKDRAKVYSEKFINSTRQGDNYDGTRYHGFNIHCFWKLNTVEFRYGAGTIDPLHIKAYYEMCLAMMNTALSDIHIDIPVSIKTMKYRDLTLYYQSNFRFRRFVKRIAKICNFSRDTVKLILTLIRNNSPKLLIKEPTSSENPCLEVSNGTHLDFTQENVDNLVPVFNIDNNNTDMFVVEPNNGEF